MSVVHKTNQEEQEQVMIFFAGKKMSMNEFLEAYGLSNESENIVNVIVEKLIKKGKLRVLNTVKSEKVFEQIAKELDLDAKLAEIELDADNVETHKAEQRKENSLCYDEVEIDFPSMSYAKDVYDFADKLKVRCELEQVDHKFILRLYNISERDLAILRRRRTMQHAGRVIFESTDKAAQAFVSSVGYTADKIIVPTAKAGLVAGLGLIRTIAKTGAAVGGTLIADTARNTRTISQELSKDSDVLRAKKELIEARDAVMRMFRRDNGGNGVRIK